MDNWNRIALYLPTFKRSDKKLPEHITSFVSKAEDKNCIYYVFVLQKCNSSNQKERDFYNDHESEVIVKRIMGELGVAYEIIYDYNINPSLARFYNSCFTDSKDKDPKMLVSMVGDDMICDTIGWDTRILETVNKTGGMGVYYTAGDERFDDALCVNAFMTRRWVNTCGGWHPNQHPYWRAAYKFQKYAPFMCPAFDANGIDIVWQRIADHVERAYYIADVTIKHEQWSRPWVGQDETSSRLGGPRKESTRRCNSHHRPHVEAADVIVKRLQKAHIGTGGTTNRLNGIVKGRTGRYWCYKEEIVKK